MLFALALVPLIGFVGLAIDGALAYMVKSKLQEALDAAALAGGRVLHEAERNQDIADFFAANYPEGYLASTGLALSVDDEETGAGRLVVSASVTVPTKFMQVLGIDSVDVSASTGIVRRPRGMELALVVDSSGSMGNMAGAGTRMEVVQRAALDLIDVLYGTEETLNDVWVSLVPFDATVNIGAQRTGWLTGYDPAQYLPPAWDRTTAYATADATSSNQRPYEAIRASTGAQPDVSPADWRPLTPVEWQGCVLARSGRLDRTDDPPAVGAFTNQFWPSTVGPDGPGPNDWTWANINESRTGPVDQALGPNLGCQAAITPLVAEKSTIEAAVGRLQSWRSTGTTVNLGLVWGWRTLSPRWRGLWGGTTPLTSPVDYGLPHIDKVMVMLTDGENDWNLWQPPPGPDGRRGPGRSEYTAYGTLDEARLGAATVFEAVQELNRRTLEVCDAIKSSGIILFTITAHIHAPDLVNMYRSCATSPAHYFNLPSVDGLEDAFRDIASELANLRLAS